MCGINGIITVKPDVRQYSGAVTAMNKALAHRGPDAEGLWSDDNAYLGHRRLSIIDLSDAGKQPMLSNDKRFVIIYNGELYNYKELKFELQRAVQGTNEKPYVFVTGTDTEVILAAYERWGKDCLGRFNGMYAFAIWDTINKNLFIARDRLGIKPLYYQYSEGSLIFSSEIRALLSSTQVPKKINRNGLADYLRYQTVHAPETIIKDVFMLMPGHFAEWKNREFKTEKYWSLKDNINYSSKGKSYSEICKDVNELLYKAVERRLIADVPFGAFLSGGIDSSAIVGMMSKISSEKVRTFSITFDESEFSEATYAKLIAKKFNTEHTEIRLTEKDFLNELPNALQAMDHPSGDGPNTYVVSKATKNAGITMALSGLGGDELFCGYEIFKRSYDLEKKYWLNLIPRMFRNAAGDIYKYRKKTIAADKIAELISKPIINFEYAYPISRQVLNDKQVLALLKHQGIPMNAVYKMARLQDFSDNKYRLTKYSIAEITSYMQNVLLRDTDQMSMASALEVRVPFIDYKLTEYVLGIEDQYKYPHSPKKLLVDSLGDMLPREIIDRPKMGFVFPWQQWLKGELKDFCETNLHHLYSLSALDKSVIETLWSRFLNNDPKVTWSRVWHLVVLGHWLNKNEIVE